jgi:hypothetical protein
MESTMHVEIYSVEWAILRDAGYTLESTYILGGREFAVMVA